MRSLSLLLGSIRASRSGLALAFVSIACLAGGCSSSDGDDGSGGTAPAQTACDKDTRKDIYTAGLSKQASALSVKIVDSSPAAPAKGDNTMTLSITDPAGAPIDGATVSILPWMPDHAHGSAIVPSVTPMGNGTYDVTNLYYPMPGLWKVTVSVLVPGAAAPQEVAFNFCLDG
jgi:hypothetical protein